MEPSDTGENAENFVGAGWVVNAVGRVIVMGSQKTRTRDDADNSELEHPDKGNNEKRIKVGELKKGDHIYVGRYVKYGKKGGGGEEEEYIKHKGHLFQHHLLIGEFDPEAKDTEATIVRKFKIYEFTGDGSGIPYCEKKNADTRDYWVNARKERGNDNRQWLFGKSREEKDFSNYVKRGLNRFTHEIYEKQDIEIVLKRARLGCQKSFKGKYDPFHMNCEHFITFCKGLCKYGYCYQFESFGKHLFLTEEELSRNRPDEDEQKKAICACLCL